jgi:hypothetical protein
MDETNDIQAVTQAENRRFPRIRLKLTVHYRKLKQGVLSAPEATHALDFGAQGMAMRGPQAMRIGQLLLATLLVPPREKRKTGPEETDLTCSSEECIPIQILSRVAWCQPQGGNNFLLGIKFLDLKPEHQHLFREFLVEFNLDRPDSAHYL